MAMNMKMGFRTMEDALTFALTETEDGVVTSMEDIETGEITWMVEYNFI